MAININDNFQINAPRGLDARSFKISSGKSVPYASVTEANNALFTSYRHKGLVVAIEDGTGVKWHHYRDGVLDSDLVPMITLDQALRGGATSAIPATFGGNLTLENNLSLKGQANQFVYLYNKAGTSPVATLRTSGTNNESSLLLLQNTNDSKGISLSGLSGIGAFNGVEVKSSTHKASLEFGGGANVTIGLPTTSGTLALVTDLADYVAKSLQLTINGVTQDLSANRSWTIATDVGSVAWGTITGTLSGQTDLQAALDAKADTVHSHAFADLTAKPTTLAGYGITDAASTSHSHTLQAVTTAGNVTSTDIIVDAGANPNATLSITSGYGSLSVTDNAGATTAYRPDRVSRAGVDVMIPAISGTLALVSQIPTQTSQLTNNSGFITTSGVTWSNLSGKPNSLSGYGISDARAYNKQTHTSGASVTVSDTKSWLIVEPALAALTITLAAAPLDGETITISFNAAITSLTINANTGHSLVQSNTPTSAEAGTSITYQFAGGKWYRQFPVEKEVIDIVTASADASPTSESANLITSGAVYTALAENSRLNLTAVGTTSITLSTSHLDGGIETTANTTVTITIPTNATTAFPIGSVITIEQIGSGQVNFSPASGVTLRSADNARKIRAQYGAAQLRKRATDEWTLVGDLSV